MPVRSPHTFSRRSLAVGSAALSATAMMGHAVQADERPGASPAASPVSGSPTLLLRMETVGGPNAPMRPPSAVMTGPERPLGAVPEFSLYDDGSIYRLGPVIAIFPPPALPNVTRMRVSAHAVETIVERARLAGLDQPRNVTNPTLQDDALLTRFRFLAGDRYQISVVWGIFTEAEPLPDWDEATVTAYQQLRELASYLANLPFNLPEEDLLDQEIPIDPDRLQVIAFETSAAQPLPVDIVDPEQPPLTWPLSTPLAELTTPYDPNAGLLPEGGCAVITGADAQSVIETSRQGNLLSPWVDDDTTYGVLLTPLLPDQRGCEALPA